MRQLLLIALRNLAQHRRRTFLLGGAIAGVTLFLLLLTALSAGIHQTMLESATTLMTGHVNVAGFYKVTAGQSAPVVTQYKKVLDIVKQFPEVDYVAARGRGWAKLVSETASSQVGIAGIDIMHEPGIRRVVQLESGNLDDLAQPGTIMLFAEQAKRLEVKVGDTLTFSAPTLRGSNNTIDVRVVAIARDMGLFSSFNTFIPAETLRRLYQMNDEATGALLVYLKDMKQIPRFEAKIRDALQAAGYRVMDANPTMFWMKFQSVNREDWTGQKLDITAWEDEISFMSWILSSLFYLTAILTTLLGVIIAVGIIDTMYIAIRERTREIGTLRAIGMQRGRVLWMMLLEAVQLALASTVAGAALAWIISFVLNTAEIKVPKGMQLFLMRDHLWLWVQTPTVILSVVLITFLTGLAALYPSYRAAKLRPVTAMHHIG